MLPHNLCTVRNRRWSLARLYMTCSTPYNSLVEDFARVREHSANLCAPLEIEDYGVQSMPDASPAKWHLAHTTWFFEQLVLGPFAQGYRVFHPQFAHLFNSYYESLGTFFTRRERGTLTRPTVEEVYTYRAYVNQAMAALLGAADHPDRAEIERRTILGLNHEQQHQELLLTDIKHAFAMNPLRPIYLPAPDEKNSPLTGGTPPWLEFGSGVKEIGHNGEGFAYDNESPRHKVFLDSYALAPQPVTNSEFIGFIDAGGYGDADLWLSDAWALLKTEKWQAPLYWEKREGHWWSMTLHGMQPVKPDAPVCHVSFYEAAAFARSAGKRLPTEAEWENAAGAIDGDPSSAGHIEPGVAAASGSQFYGDVWEWTSSAYTEYPGYRRLEGTFGEYNGKFMSGQMVLRGGSCLTSRDHIRPSYRNFFPSHIRWQYSGFRLAEDR